MKKIDAIVSLAVGFFLGLFLYIALSMNNIETPCLLIFLIFFPLLSLLGMLAVTLLGKKFLFIYQAGKFILIGGMSTLIDFGILNVLMIQTGINAGTMYSVFVGISFVVATILKYFGDKFWAFEQMEKKGMGKEFFHFVLVTVVGGAIHVGVASVVVNWIGPQFGMTPELWANVGKIVGIAAAFTWNFIGYKFLVFKK